MQQKKIDAVWVPMSLPYESSTFRPFTDTENDNYRLVGTYSTDGNVYNIASGGTYNMYVTQGGRLRVRPGTRAATWIGTGGSILSAKRIDRIWYYETLPDASGNVYSYILMSVFDYGTSLWQMYYNKVGTTTYTAFTATRQCQASEAPHWVGISRGKAYIKGFPSAASGEKLGTIIFTGGSGAPTFQWWGLLGPATAVRMSGWIGKLDATVTETAANWTVSSATAPPPTPFPVQCDIELCTCTAVVGAGPYTLTVTRGISGTKPASHVIKSLAISRYDWTASNFQVKVDLWWQYAIGYKSSTGQISPLSPKETDQTLMPSITGSFGNLIPKMTAPTTNDTTNVPNLVMFRTTNGGGLFGKLEEFPNPGGTSFPYLDDSGANSDPVSDKDLDTAAFSSAEPVNAPPPSVNPPQVVGTDTPSKNTTKIALYQRRFWYAIDHRLYYSGEEEIVVGNPEESWPAGSAANNSGNVIVFNNTIVAIESTFQALYIMTTGATYILTGSNRDQFNVSEIGDTYPMDARMKEASVSFKNRVAFVTANGRVAVITGNQIDVISEPIAGVTAVATLQVAFYSDAQNEWLCILAPARNANSNSIMWVYDWQRSMNEQRDFWYAPFSGTWSAMVGVQSGSNLTSGLLLLSSFDSVSATKSSALAHFVPSEMGSTLAYDEVLSNGIWATTNIGWTATIWPFKNPAGNLVNARGVPGRTSAIARFIIDCNVFSSSNVPKCTVNYDQSTLGATVTSNALTPLTPTRRKQSTGYYTFEYAAHKVMQDCSISIDNSLMLTATTAEFYRMAVMMMPSGGPG